MTVTRSSIPWRNPWVLMAALVAVIAMIVPAGMSLASSNDDLRVGVFSTGETCDTTLGANGKVTGLVYGARKLSIGTNRQINGTAWAGGDLLVDSNARMNGPVHTNGRLTVKPNAKHNHDSNATYVTGVKLYPNTSTWHPIQVSPRPALPSPFLFTGADYAPGGSKAQAAGQHYHYHSGGLTVGANKTLAKGLHYVKGNVSLGANVKGNVTIVATGKITVAANVKLDPYIDQLGLMTTSDKGCNVAIAVSSNVKVGTLFAPKAGVQVGSNSTVDGAAAGKRVTIDPNAVVLGAEIWHGELECGDSTGERQDGNVTSEIIRHENADDTECAPKLFRLVPDETDEQHGSVVFEVLDPSDQPRAFFEAHLTFKPDVPVPSVKLEYDPDGSDGYDDFKEMPYCEEDPFVGEGGTPNPDAIPDGHEGCVIEVTQHYDGTTEWHVVFMGDWKFR